MLLGEFVRRLNENDRAKMTPRADFCPPAGRIHSFKDYRDWIAPPHFAKCELCGYVDTSQDDHAGGGEDTVTPRRVLDRDQVLGVPALAPSARASRALRAP